MIGGMNWPPVEALASMAPASTSEYPDFFIMGMVTTPVVVTLEMALPEIEPNNAEATTATLAEPPRRRPMVAEAISVKNSPPPVLNST